MLLIFSMVQGSLTDDAYITLAYAKNLALHLHWGLIPHEVANTASSPLNVLLLGAVSAATRIAGGVHPVLALGIVSVGLAILMAWAWIRVILALRLPFTAAVLGVALVLANPFVLSAIGLEVLLIPTLLILLVAMALERRWTSLGVVAGLTLVARLDLIVFVVLIAAATPGIRRRWPRALAAAVLVAAPWFAFSWFFFGSAVPDTMLIKLSQPLFGIWSYVTGPVMYFTGRPGAVALAFVPALGGVVALVGWIAARTSIRWATPDALPPLGPAAALGGGGLVYYAVYSVAGVGPYHWYYVPPTTSLSMFLAIAVGAWMTIARERARLRPAAPALVLGVVALLALGNLAVDLRQGVPWRSPVIFGNWASAHDYKRVGAALRREVGTATVASPGEVGTLAYSCDCAIVDEFSDRGDAIRVINHTIATAGPVSRLLLELNYLSLDRDQRPRHVDYQLRYHRGPGSGPDVWQVRSASYGVGHFRLVPVSDRG